MAAVPRRGRRIAVPPGLVGGLPAGQRAVRRARRPRSPRRARPSGCTTTSCSWSRRCCASCGPTCGSASSCTSRSRRSSCSCRLPWRTQIIHGLLGADLIGFQLPGGARNFSRLAQVAGRRGDHRRHDRVRRPHDPGRRVPDLDRLGRAVRAGRHPADPRRRRSSCGTSSATRSKIILGVDRLDYTKGIDVRLRAFGELLAEERPGGRERGDGADRHPEPGAAGLLPADARGDRAAGRRAQRRLRPDRPAGRALPAPVAAPGGPGRVLRRRRRDDGDAVAGRDEPGRQGVRGLPGGRRRRAAAVRVHRRRQGAAGRRCWSTRTTPTG